MKVVAGIDSGVNGGVCVLYPDKAACAAPVGNITELRDILSAAKKYADEKAYVLECFVEEVTGYIGSPRAVHSSWASHTAQFWGFLSEWKFRSAPCVPKSGNWGFRAYALSNTPQENAG